MARTKAALLEQGSSEEEMDKTPSGRNKKVQQQKRKSGSQTPDTAKKKKTKKEESDSEDLSEDSNSEGKTEFHKGTTWPMDATLEILVNYEGVKEVRTVKSQFFPLVYHLTRGEPEKIAKAVTFIGSVDNLLKERFEKECTPAQRKATASSERKFTAVDSKLSTSKLLKTIPHYGFRDSKGKWLPKKRWKTAEILKDKEGLQKLVTQMPSRRAHMVSVNNLNIVQSMQEITELSDAKSAIQSVLSRVSLKRQQYARLLVWMRNLEMKSHAKQSPSKKSVTTRDKRETKRDPRVKKNGSKAGSSRRASTSSVHKALHGLEESAIIRDTRLRTKPKFIPYIPPKSEVREKPASVKQKLKPVNVISGSSKRFVQQSGTSESVKQPSMSSNGIQVLFRGQKFSPGCKMLLNRSEDPRNGSESEYSDGESDTSSMTQTSTGGNRESGTSSTAQISAGGNRESGRSQPPKNYSKPIVGPKSKKKMLKAKYRQNNTWGNLSTSDTDEYLEDDLVVTNTGGHRTRSPCLPRAEESPSFSLQSKNCPPKIVRFADRKRMEAKNGHKQTTSMEGNQCPNSKKGSSSGKVDSLKRKAAEEGRDSQNKSLSKKSRGQSMKDVDKSPDKKQDGEVEKVGGIPTLQKEADVDPVIIDDDVDESGEFPPPLVHIENVEGEENSQTKAECVEIGSQEAGETGTGGSSGKETTASPGTGGSSGKGTTASPGTGGSSGKGTTASPGTVGSSGKETTASPATGGSSGKETTASPLSGKEAENGSFKSDKPSASTQNTQPSTAEETLRLLVNQLSALGSSKGENEDRKVLLSKARHILSRAERGLPSSVENHQNPDIKPDVDQMHAKEVTSNRSCITSADTSNQGGNSESCDLSVEDLVTLNDKTSNGSEGSLVPSNTVVTVKEEKGEAGLRNQTESEAVIIIDDDD